MNLKEIATCAIPLISPNRPYLYDVDKAGCIGFKETDWWSFRPTGDDDSSAYRLLPYGIMGQIKLFIIPNSTINGTIRGKKEEVA